MVAMRYNKIACAECYLVEQCKRQPRNNGISAVKVCLLSKQESLAEEGKKMR